MRGLTTGFFLAASLLAQATWAEWKTTTADGVTVKSQAQPGSTIRDFSASATLSAPIEAIQSVLLDSESHAAFMPYVVESKDLGADESGKARLTYSRLEFPLVRSRDFVLRITVDKLVTGTGGDEFANHWVSAPAALPERPGVIRVRINEGSWRATRISANETRVVYKFRVDPAGWIPHVIANEASQRAIPSVFRALEAEAKRREGVERSKVESLKSKGSQPEGRTAG